MRLTDTQVAKILADDRVVSQLWDLVQGLGEEVATKKFPIELEDWECSLANTIHHIIESEHLKEESQ